ncbi:MAG TPA: PilZ domain-containing protein [Xanthobacteraceae bacterium]|nr:PilZ domain-containing protein [Xanthobacteraceae bacterium]
MREERKIENRRYSRVRPSGLVSKTGKLILDPKAPAVDCQILDLSAGGACIELRAPVNFPRRFTLVHGGTKKLCSIVWQKHLRIGVCF